jgi:hypothetical protein
MAQADSEPIPVLRAEKDLISTLPFVSEGFRDPKGVFHPRQYWHVKPAGSYAADRALAAAYARQAIDCMRQGGDIYLLALAVDAMIKKGHLGNIEICFLRDIAIAATAVHIADDGAVIVNLPCGGVAGEERYRARHRRPARRPRTGPHCHGGA